MKNPVCHDCCIICNEGQLEMFNDFCGLTRVTSDCRPWPNGGWLAVCSACGAVQKRADDVWLDECNSIYRNYAVYSQANGAEQLVYNNDGCGITRSVVILNYLDGAVKLPVNGTLLDIGCGNGSFLSSFSHKYPGWTLCGTELDGRNLKTLDRISGFDRLYTGDIRSINKMFDVVVLIHALEHIDRPVSFLKCLREELLRPGGLLIIEVPDYNSNPFDLLIADHLLHFSPSVLDRALYEAGLAPFILTNQWVPKEISAIARAGAVPTPIATPVASRTCVMKQLCWLADFAHRAAILAENAPIGVFGTGIAGSWLAGVLGERVAFFVDEDTTRIGRNYLGRSVLAPTEIPKLSKIMVAMAPELAFRVADRLNNDARNCGRETFFL